MKITPILLISIFLLFNLSCASYRVVKLAPGVDESGSPVDFYAMAKNNVVIPEYVTDERGLYPKTRDEASKRFEERKEKLKELVEAKYQVPNNLFYQTKRIIVGTGLVLVSPLTLPLEYLHVKGQKELPPEKKTVGQITKDYFSSSLDGPVYKKPILKDELENL